MIQTRIIDSYTEIYGGGNWLTQSYPTNFHTFFKRKMLTKGEKIEDFKEVTEAEKTALEKADAEWVEPPQSFIDQWNAIIGSDYRYNKATGYFEYNMVMEGVDCSIKDIPYSEALTMMIERGHGGSWNGLCYRVKKVNIYPANYFNPQISSASLFCAYNHNIEICVTAQRGDNYIPIAVLDGIARCDNLKVITGRFNNAATNITLVALPKLEELRFALTRSDGLGINVSCTPVISIASLKFTIANSTKSGTITVHPDVYAKLTDETNTEWHQVLLDAAEKNITFITTT